MQLYMEQLPMTEESGKAGLATPRAIECDDFPFEQLSRIAERESWRKEIYRPIYHVHKWWAQRLGSVFRGILIGTLAPKGADVLDLFYSPVRFPDTVVFDPFMGSGTTLGETLKLGGRAIGRDINPVSYLQVRTALTLRDSEDLERMYQEIAADVADTISGYYTTILSDGALHRVLYYFWVMQAQCPICCTLVDLFSNYIFAKHANPRRNSTVYIVCPKCSGLSPENYQVKHTECSKCGHHFDATAGSVKGKVAKCSNCLCEFVIGRAIRETGSPPAYRMYAKLVLTANGEKEYQPITDYDEALYQKAVTNLRESDYKITHGTIEPGYNTNQVLNYGFKYWNQMFNARQLLCIATLANRIKEIDDIRLQDAFTCLISGALEFNNMFASYKGEGTGAVRHMFHHHILKPERTPLEANLWGTPKSSGAFSTLFRSRLLRAAQYARQPFELALSSEGQDKRSVKVNGINDPLAGVAVSDSYEQFDKDAKLYVSCGDSAVTDIPDRYVDVVVTDPPFFDNVHYSQLADFFYDWQRLILVDYPSHRASTTRSELEVQNSDVGMFTERLTLVLQEAARVLKDDGLLVFTYHHSRWEGWRSILYAVVAAEFHIVICHPVKAEMSVATPKRQAKAPINFDIIMVCRKNQYVAAHTNVAEKLRPAPAIKRAEAQITRLQADGWELSRNDIGVVVMAQSVAEISRQSDEKRSEQAFEEIEYLITEAIDQIHSWNSLGKTAEA